MEITRKNDLKTVDAPPEYFTGKVTITGQFRGPIHRVSVAPLFASRPVPERLGTPILPDRP